MCPVSSKSSKFNKKVKNLQRIEESIFSDTYFTVKRAFVAILTSTYLLQFTRFIRLLRCTPSRTGYDKSSTSQVMNHTRSSLGHPGGRSIPKLNHNSVLGPYSQTILVNNICLFLQDLQIGT